VAGDDVVGAVGEAFQYLGALYSVKLHVGLAYLPRLTLNPARSLPHKAPNAIALVGGETVSRAS
jgi:hypothetical protein